MKNMLLYVATIATIMIVAVIVHLAVSVDWPWAIATGALAAVILRAAIDWHRTGSTPRRKTPARP